jgi:DNA mismatch repair ATPase MutS
MTASSVLFPSGVPRPAKEVGVPPFFTDLNLDQIVQAVTLTKQEYELTEFFHEGPQGHDTILFRQQIFQDLELPEGWNTVKAFERGMRAVREKLVESQKRYYDLQKQAWFLKAVNLYCSTVTELARGLSSASLRSQGLSTFHQHLVDYVEFPSFRKLAESSRQIQADLDSIRYGFTIARTTIRVRRSGDEADLSAEVGKTFEKFQQGAVKDHSLDFSYSPDMNHVEAKILELVARLYPEVFQHLALFCTDNTQFAADLVTAFDREIQFYVAYLDYINTVRAAALPFCYPELSPARKDIFQTQGFDLALAHQSAGPGKPVVTNDFQLTGTERLMIVSGPNQGGKTTFARAFGQAHFLAGIGCPVPGSEARLFLYDHLYTHFETEEDLHSQNGKLFDELLRFQTILGEATSNSVLVMNEIFNSTTLRDAVVLARRILERVSSLDALGVCVTFLDEVATLNEKTVSFASAVVPENPVERTFKIVRKPADGLAYALSIAQKHGLTYGQLLERLSS